MDQPASSPPSPLICKVEIDELYLNPTPSTSSGLGNPDNDPDISGVSAVHIVSVTSMAAANVTASAPMTDQAGMSVSSPLGSDESEITLPDTPSPGPVHGASTDLQAGLPLPSPPPLNRVKIETDTWLRIQTYTNC